MENNQDQTPKAEVQILETLVQSGDTGMFTTSLIIAEAFGKEHKNVLQIIDHLECSPEFNQLNFKPVEYKDAKGEMRPAYQLTRDGFAFLAMGFTGKKAAAWKEKFLMAFNTMEASLLGRQREEAHSQLSDSMKGHLPFLQQTVAVGRCSDRQIKALEDLLVFWCYVEGCTFEEALKTLLTYLRIPSLNDLQQCLFVEATNFIWRSTFQRTDYTNVFQENEEFNVLKALIRTWEFFCGHEVHCIEYYICTSTHISSIQEVAPKDIRKLIFSAFCGFIERFPNPKNPRHKAEGTVQGMA